MEIVIDFLQIVIPAGLVLYAVFLIVRSFLNKQFQENHMQLRADTTKTALPLRLQAYERMAIFLERITPNNLISRLNDGSYNVAQFQHILVHDIKQEFYHNLSQQIYMSDEAWELTRQAMENTISTINHAAQGLDPEAPSIDLARKIFEQVLSSDTNHIAQALKFLKDEIRTIF